MKLFPIPFLTVLFVFITLNSLGQFNLNMKFTPKYMDVSYLKVKKHGENMIITFHTDKISDSAYLNQAAKTDIHEYFKNNMPKKDTNQSILAVHVEGSYSSEYNVQEFAFNKPTRTDIEHELIALLWTIMYTQFENEEVITYLEHLESQFDFGFGLKVISEDPLTYKLYGRITAHDTEAFYNFIDVLPAEDTIYFDMVNFQSMGKSFYPSFGNLSQKNPNIYWYNCSHKTRVHLLNSGIHYDHVKLKDK